LGERPRRPCASFAIEKLWEGRDRDAVVTRVAVVTGGASGIGRATAELLKARGVSVAIFDTHGEHSVDVSDDQAVNLAVDRVHARQGPRGGGRQRRRHPRGLPNQLGCLCRVVAACPRGERDRCNAHGAGVSRRPPPLRCWTNRERGLDRVPRRRPIARAVNGLQTRFARLHPLAGGGARSHGGHGEVRAPGCDPHGHG
jgi:NAD(P)-dependent dehydrogenase (short-subunit alcohol dehydrogenase family)